MGRGARSEQHATATGLRVREALSRRRPAAGDPDGPDWAPDTSPAPADAPLSPGALATVNEICVPSFPWHQPDKLYGGLRVLSQWGRRDDRVSDAAARAAKQLVHRAVTSEQRVESIREMVGCGAPGQDFYALIARRGSQMIDELRDGRDVNEVTNDASAFNVMSGRRAAKAAAGLLPYREDAVARGVFGDGLRHAERRYLHRRLKRDLTWRQALEGMDWEQAMNRVATPGDETPITALRREVERFLHDTSAV